MDYFMEESKPTVSPFKAYINFWKKAFSFRSRIRRSEFWFAILINVIIIALLYLCMDYLAPSMMTWGEETGNIVISAIGEKAYQISNVVTAVFILISFLPTVSAIVRRLHDIDKYDFMDKNMLRRFFGALVMDSDPGPNKYGESPKYSKNSPEPMCEEFKLGNFSFEDDDRESKK